MPCSNRRRRALAVVGAALLALPFLLVGAVPIEAQTSVTTEQQLRDAVAADAATILLGANITLTCDGPGNGPLAVDSNTTLRSSSTEMRTLTVNGSCRIIEVTGGASLTVERLHLTGGRAPNGVIGPNPGAAGTPGGNGGAIVSDGTVTITDSRFSDNRAGTGGPGAAGALATPGGIGGAGGPGGSGGAIFTTGAVTATRTTFENNRAGDGGAGGLGGAGEDGADGEPGEAGSAAGNGGSGGAGGNGGAVAAGGAVTVARSTLTANHTGAGGIGGAGGAGGDGGDGENGNPGGVGGAAGIGGVGGAAGSGGAVSAGSVTVTTSTLHANQLEEPGTGGAPGSPGAGGESDPPGTTAAAGAPGASGAAGAHGAGGATSTTGNASFTSSTVTANAATDGGAARSLAVGGALTLNHTYVGGTGAGDDCDAGSFASVTSSLAGDSSCTGATVQANPDLANLANNGGPTQTRLPNASSPLVNAGAATCPETTDQRGIQRKQGANCDIGAVERRGALTATIAGSANNPTAPVGDDVTVTFTVTIAGTATGSLTQDELAPTITGCTSTPIRSGSPAPYVANDVITWTCTVTSAAVGSVNVAYAATVISGEGTTLPLNATVPVQFQQATTTTTAEATTTTTAVVVGEGGATGSTGGALPRTGLSILVTLVAGAALVFGGTSMSKVARARAEKSPRWNVKYGVPYPAGTHRQRTRDDQI